MPASMRQSLFHVCGLKLSGLVNSQYTCTYLHKLYLAMLAWSGTGKEGTVLPSYPGSTSTFHTHSINREFCNHFLATMNKPTVLLMLGESSENIIRILNPGGVVLSTQLSGVHMQYKHYYSIDII